jgi:ribosomal protein S18 acetylase RimI-like enzyme
MLTQPYTVAVFGHGNDVSAQDRARLVHALEEITDELWYKDPFLVRKLEPHLFVEDTGFIAVSARSDIVGFLVYRRLNVDGEHVLYLVALDVRAAHQGRGITRLIAERVLTTTYAEWPEGPVYLASRTRNPIAWDWYRRLCSRVVPDLLTGDDDPALVKLCTSTAERLYPELTLEVPSMIMRGAYPELAAKDPQHHHDPRLDALFFENASLARREDAVFSLGRALAPRDLIGARARPAWAAR